VEHVMDEVDLDETLDTENCARFARRADREAA
jgi:hypothetical protein